MKTFVLLLLTFGLSHLFFSSSLEAQDSEIKDFEALKEADYQPTARYRIRDFDKGSVGTFQGVLSDIEDRLDRLQKEMGSLKSTLQSDKQTEALSRLSLLEEQRKSISKDFHDQKRALYKTNLSLDPIREHIKTLEIQWSAFRQLHS